MLTRNQSVLPVFILCFVAVASSGLNTGASTEPERVYHGTIREDAQEGEEVELDVPLHPRSKIGNDICGYTVYKSGMAPIPFKVILTNHKTGEAKVVLSVGSQLDYEQTNKYEFEIAADDCATGAHSTRDKVHIEVEDINDFSPVWKEQSYITEVVEGQIVDEIVKLEAFDGDGTERFSKICHYHLLTPDVPFDIADNGYLRNTEPLNYAEKHNYILEMKAEDCGGRTTDKLLVNILVKPACKSGWKGVVSTVQYVLESGRARIADNSTLDLCSATCQPKQVAVTISLQSQDTDTTCAVDDSSISSRNNICGASSDTIDLLVLAGSVRSTEDDSETGVSFDGKTTAFQLKSPVLEAGLDSTFTVSMWMRNRDLGVTENNIKQNILCSSDAEAMNRHHYALFVHNCRLILLLRQEPKDGVDLNVFKPAEWRWMIPEVCDGAWHHYAVSVDSPQVRLYVDGKLFVADKNKQTVLDDWPLHPSKKVKLTKLVVGACWEGSQQRMNQFFHGELASLTILPHTTESDQTIKCINSCKEKLDFHAINEMETGMSISMNSEMTQMSLNGRGKEGVERLVDRFGYVNSRSKPMTGTSLISLLTLVTCSDGSNVSIPTHEIVVRAGQRVVPTLAITGSSHLSREESDIQRGDNIFHDLLIFIQTKPVTDDEVSADVSDAKFQLDSCTVRVEPQMISDIEHLRVPEGLLKEHSLEAEITSGGLVLTGAGKLSAYADVLRQTVYIHSRPEDLNSRTFGLTCTELNDHYASNQLLVQLSVIHTDAVVGVPQHAVGENKIMQPVVNYKLDSDAVAASNKIKPESHTSGVGIAIVVIVCIGFLVFIIALGVVRIRSAQQRSVHVNIEEKQEEMEWDNTALTITVNPMDRETGCEDLEVNGLQDTDTDDDIGSFHDDGPDSSEEEEPEKTKDRDLEWDSSTVTY